MNRLALLIITILSVSCIVLCAALSSTANKAKAVQAALQAAHVAELSKLQLEQQAAATKLVNDTNKVIDVVHRESDLAQAQARNTIIGLQTQTTQRRQTIERLERENAALKIWGDAPLPADLVRLRQRPAIDNAAAYRDWLSEGESLPATQQPPADQPGSAEQS